MNEFDDLLAEHSSVPGLNPILSDAFWQSIRGVHESVERGEIRDYYVAVPNSFRAAVSGSAVASGWIPILDEAMDRMCKLKEKKSVVNTDSRMRCLDGGR